jgi:arylmalonate decarboxylase
VLPSVNVVVDVELARLLPPGVTYHATRLLLDGPATPESYERMGQNVARAAQELATAEVDAVAYSCTVGSAGSEGAQVVQVIERICGVPAITTADAVLEAFAALGAGRIAVATPYVSEVNEAERRFLEQAGLEVLCIEGLGIGRGATDRRTFSHQPPSRTYALACSVDRPEAEAIFLSCANLPTLEIVAALERDLGKPVVTSNGATLRAVLRRAGVRQPIAGYGRLLEQA